MYPSFLLGKVVEAANQNEAILLFQLRRKLDIGGVIFTPEITIPEWSAEEKGSLSRTKVHIHPSSMRPVDETQLRDVWKARAGDVTFNLVELSKKFNQTTRTRGVWFIEDDELKFGAHRDPIAESGFIHVHCSGAGMVCLSPKGDKPVRMRASNKENTNFPQTEIKRLYNEGLVEPVALKPRQAIAFDHTMVHYSQAGMRFRILAFDKK